MSAPQVELQISAAATLLADSGVTDIVAASTDGKAVFAIGQTYENVYPRTVLETPQWLPRSRTCGRQGDLILTVHSWARGADCTLVVGRLADAVTVALGRALTLVGWRVSSWEDEGSASVGDPTAGVAHVVTRLRYSVQQTG